MSPYDPWGFGALQLANSYSRPLAWQNATVGAVIITSAEMNQLNTEIEKFGDEVTAAASVEIFEAGKALDKCAHDGMTWDGAKNVCTTIPNPSGSYPTTIETPLGHFRSTVVTDLLGNWHEFRDSQLPTAIAVGPFQTIKAQFESAVNDWKAMGQTTTAKPPPVFGPSAADDIADIGDGLVKWGPWLVGAALIFGGLYLASPIIAGYVGSRRK